MTPDYLQYNLRRTYSNYKKGLISKSFANNVIKSTYSKLKNPIYKNYRRTIKKDLLYFSKLLK
jgi:hypothetical protein